MAKSIIAISLACLITSCGNSDNSDSGHPLSGVYGTTEVQWSSDPWNGEIVATESLSINPDGTYFLQWTSTSGVHSCVHRGAISSASQSGNFAATMTVDSVGLKGCFNLDWPPLYEGLAYIDNDGSTIIEVFDVDKQIVITADRL